MTPEEQRIAIAEVVFVETVKRESLSLLQHPKGTVGYRGSDLGGWWIMQRPDGAFYGMNFPSESECYVGNVQEIARSNNYPEDLNAMNKAEEVLSEMEQELFADNIIKQFPTDRSNGFAWIHATATLRADAFLRTKGKYK